MMQREELLIALAILNLVMTGALFALLLARRLRRTEVDIVLDAIEGARDQVDHHSRDTALEHESIFRQLHTLLGRVQFLMAKSIADELAIERAKDKQI